MDLALVANVYFEEELQGKAFRFHPILQYLPLLYGERRDLVIVDRLPPSSFFWEGPTCLLADDPRLSSCLLSPWGYSEQVVQFAKGRGLKVDAPSLEAVRLVASKAFCFEEGFHLDGAAILSSKEELVLWGQSIKGPKILKTLYGMTGRGHYIFEDEPIFEAFPVLAERFVRRELDFSSQWFLSDKVYFLGLTHLINHERGGYRATRVGDEKELFGSYYSQVQEAVSAQKELLQKAFAKGYRGYCGIDAMIYEGGLLQPALEINARKTMGQIALAVAQKQGHGGTLFFSSDPQEKAFGLLPVVKKNQKQLWFNSF